MGEAEHVEAEDLSSKTAFITEINKLIAPSLNFLFCKKEMRKIKFTHQVGLEHLRDSCESK